MVALIKYPTDYVPPDWLPNWKNSAEYTDHGDDTQAWAWEFLRRNPEYQADYAHYMSVPCFYPGGGKTPKLAGRSIQPDASMIYYHAPGRLALGHETFREYEQATGLEPVPLEYHLLQKWEILTLEDPAKLAAPGFGPEHDTLPPYFIDFAMRELDCGPRSKIFPCSEWMAGRLIVASWPEDEDDYVAAVGIDLRYNIPDQLEEIGKVLAEIKKDREVKTAVQTKGAGLDVLLTTLRTLDGHLRGVAQSKLAALHLDPRATKLNSDTPCYLKEDMDEMYLKRSSQGVKDAISRAEGLVFGGYKKMLKYAFLPKKQARKRK